MTPAEARRRIDKAFRNLMRAKDSRSFSPLIPKALTAGKLYEAFIVGKIAEQLVNSEGYRLQLVNSSYLPLKSSPGPVNRTYPRIELRKAGTVVAEMWTDVEFVSLSHNLTRRWQPEGRGDYHELDIMIIDPGVSGRPRHDQIWLAAECKNTGYTKNLLKEILGIRRELSLLQAPQPTRFGNWPRASVPAKPASCLLVFSTDRGVQHYSAPGATFGIDFFFQELSP